MAGIQVAKAHYDWTHYNRKGRWASYWHQIDEVLATRAGTCLEIGTGAGEVRDALTRLGVEVTTVDIDAALGPELVGDVRDLPCADAAFDVVLAAQVLEHIPWRDVPRAVSEIRRVCRSGAVVSLPQSGIAIGLTLSTSISRIGEPGVSLRVGTPRRHRFDGQHYWQVGARDTGRRAVREVLAAGFRVVREYAVPEFTYHRFYVLERV
jgi:SAM-dependent methyltransferase